jgi:hypothetical protein
MLTVNTQFEHELGKLIDDEIGRIQTILGDGVAVSDFADYRNLTGQIAGLSRVKSYCDEVNTILSKR